MLASGLGVAKRTVSDVVTQADINYTYRQKQNSVEYSTDQLGLV